jgi:hypothetical protein
LALGSYYLLFVIENLKNFFLFKLFFLGSLHYSKCYCSSILVFMEKYLCANVQGGQHQWQATVRRLFAPNLLYETPSRGANHSQSTNISAKNKTFQNGEMKSNGNN